MRTDMVGGAPGRLRSFDPARVADLEFRAWVGYYRRDWPGVLRASAGLHLLTCRVSAGAGGSPGARFPSSAGRPASCAVLAAL